MERNEVNPLLAIIITMGVIGYPTLRSHTIDHIGVQNGHSTMKPFL